MISLSELWLKRAQVDGRLVAFFKCSCVYLCAGSSGTGGAMLALAKCAPILCLLACTATTPGKYARMISVGLALSALGDAALVYERGLALGLAFFSLAHLVYAAALGATPLRPKLLLALAPLLALYLSVVAESMWGRGERWLVWAVCGYSMAAGGAWWRGAARGGHAATGLSLFLLSDAALGYHMFVNHIPYKQLIVMSTYYLGQFFVALSALPPTCLTAAGYQGPDDLPDSDTDEISSHDD